MTTATKPSGGLRISSQDVRLLGCCLAGSILLALMTGPDGTDADPTQGIKGALDSARVIPFLLFGVALWAFLTVLRKVRSGELAGIAGARDSLKASVRETWDAWLRSVTIRRAIGAVTFVVAMLVALFIADLSGPIHADKVSLSGLQRQLHFSYAYGYLLFAVVLWVLASRRVLERHGLRDASQSRTGPLHTALVIVGCLAGGLVIAFTANPWLDPAIHSSDLALSDHGTSIFWQWPTYLYLLLSLFVAYRVLQNQHRGRTTKARSTARRGFLTPQLSLTLYVAVLFIAIEWPKFLPVYWQSDITAEMGVYALLALGLNVVVGFTGLLDLGYVAFYAVGAYTAAYFSGQLPIHPPHVFPLFVSMPIAIGAAMLAGILLGLPTLRLRGDYLAIVTLGFGEIVEVLLNNWTTVTNGSLGTGHIPPFTINFLGIHYVWNNAEPLPYYYLILAFIVVAILFFSSLNNSRVGRRWASIREDEVAASSIGVNPLKYKVMAFAIGASTAGFAGVFTASLSTYLFPSPQNFGLQLSILILSLVIFGGMGSIVGVLFGAAAFNFAFLYLQLHPFPGYQDQDFFMYVGAIFVLLMIFRPQGMIPSRRRAREIRLAEAGVGMADPMSAERGESDQFEGPTSDEGSVAPRGAP